MSAFRVGDKVRSVWSVHARKLALEVLAEYTSPDGKQYIFVHDPNDNIPWADTATNFELEEIKVGDKITRYGVPHTVVATGLDYESPVIWAISDGAQNPYTIYLSEVDGR